MKDNSFKTIVVDDRKEYICIPDCPFRLVFEDGEYVGWYYCGEDEMDFCGELCNFAEGLIKKAKPQWIPVSERLPKYNTFVIVFAEGIVGEAVLDDADYWYWAGTDEYASEINVTHWMPLPEAPKCELAEIVENCEDCGFCDKT